jgi:hypothetical protein
VDVKLYSIQPSVLDLLPLDWCRHNSILPLDQFGKTLAIACVELPTHETIQEIAQRTGCSPFLYVGLRRAMRDVIDETLKRRSSRPAIAKGAAAAPVAAPRVEEPPPVPDDLPRISLRLSAAAAGAPRKPAIERYGRPSAPAAGVVAPVPVAPSVPMVAKSSPMQQLLGRRTSVPEAAPAPVAAPVARRDDPPKPKLGSRAAPVLPPAGTRPRAAAGANGEWESIFDEGENAVRRSSQGGDPPAPKS